MVRCDMPMLEKLTLTGTSLSDHLKGPQMSVVWPVRR